MSKEHRYAPTIFAVAATINSLPPAQADKIFKYLGGKRAICQALMSAGNKLHEYETNENAEGDE